MIAALVDLVARQPEQTNAPVLTVPRVFEPEICRHLIALYEQDGGKDSGFMQQQGGKTIGRVDHSFKRRADYDLVDTALREALLDRMRRRLAPQIQRAFQFEVTRIERWIVACYDGEIGGFFRPHRDNTTAATAHRAFACTINLNAEDYEGGELRFPEFGPRTYRAPTGGAVIFSCSLLHEATPVTGGRRYAFLPFFYDEARARLRERNQSALVGGNQDYRADEAEA
jgi:predicted 2-oxoglutarate/Fe(II)-dependent dioxygenase YbiX